MEDVNKDARFAHISKDPRYHKMRRDERKVKIDKRFRGMMKDSNFKVKYSVDPRGRPIHATTNENLRKFYDLSNSDLSSSDSEHEEGNVKMDKVAAAAASKKGDNSLKLTDILGKRDVDTLKAPTKVGNEAKNVSNESNDEEDEEEVATKDAEETSEGDEEEEESSSEDESSEDGSVDYARGEGGAQSSSEDEDDDDEGALSDDQDDEDFDHEWAEHDKSAPCVSEATRRLAVCNMDWDRVKPRDLMVLFNSFKPPGGIIQSVAIYPSEFGLARMKEEDVSGPQELREIAARNKKSSKKGTSQEGEEYHMEKLRQYQLNRLRYYYAIVECDSRETADHIYTQCDGNEYESSATRLDLRFIPDDMEFEVKPTSLIQDVPEVVTYKPTLFANTALQQSKVSLTWDETERDRMALTADKLSAEELEALDVRDYLASDSDGYDEDPYGGLEDPDFGPTTSGTSTQDPEVTEKADIEKYRALVKGMRDSEEQKDTELKGMEMEISWEPGLKEAAEGLVKKKKEAGTLTPWEEYQAKRREKNRQKRENRKQNQDGSEQEDQQSGAEDHGDSSDDDLPGGIDLNDPYFKEELDKVATKPADKKKGDGKKSKKQKKREKAAEGDLEQDDGLSLLVMDQEEEDKAHFSLRAIQEAEKTGKKKRKLQLRKKKETSTAIKDNFKLDVEDNRFKELFSNPHYNIDPTAPEFKKTRAMESVIEEKMRRRQEEASHKEGSMKRGANSDGSAKRKKAKSTGEETSVDQAARAKDYSLVNLVKSVKAKTQTFQDKKGKKKR